MTNFPDPRDPASGGASTAEPAAAAARGRGVMSSNNAWTLVAIVVAVAIGLAIWGWGGPVGDGTANHRTANSEATPVYGGAATTLAPAPAPTGNGSNH